MAQIQALQQQVIRALTQAGLPELTPGDRMAAVVLRKDGDQYLFQNRLMLFKGESDVPLNPGDTLQLRYEGLQDGKMVLRELTQSGNGTARTDLAQATLRVDAGSIMKGAQTEVLSAGQQFFAAVISREGDSYLLRKGDGFFLAQSDIVMEPGEKGIFTVKSQNQGVLEIVRSDESQVWEAPGESGQDGVQVTISEMAKRMASYYQRTQQGGLAGAAGKPALAQAGTAGQAAAAAAAAARGQAAEGQGAGAGPGSAEGDAGAVPGSAGSGTAADVVAGLGSAAGDAAGLGSADGSAGAGLMVGDAAGGAVPGGLSGASAAGETGAGGLTNETAADGLIAGGIGTGDVSSAGGSPGAAPAPGQGPEGQGAPAGGAAAGAETGSAAVGAGAAAGAGLGSAVAGAAAGLIGGAAAGAAVAASLAGQAAAGGLTNETTAGGLAVGGIGTGDASSAGESPGATAQGQAAAGQGVAGQGAPAGSGSAATGADAAVGPGSAGGSAATAAGSGSAAAGAGAGPGSAAGLTGGSTAVGLAGGSAAAGLSGEVLPGAAMVGTAGLQGEAAAGRMTNEAGTGHLAAAGTGTGEASSAEGSAAASEAASMVTSGAASGAAGAAGQTAAVPLFALLEGMEKLSQAQMIADAMSKTGDESAKEPVLATVVRELSGQTGPFFHHVGEKLNLTVMGKIGNGYIVKSGTDLLLINIQDQLTRGEQALFVVLSDSKKQSVLKRISQGPEKPMDDAEKTQQVLRRFGVAGARDMQTVQAHARKIPGEQTAALRYLLDPNLLAAVLMPEQARQVYQRVEVTQYQGGVGREESYEIALCLDLEYLGHLEISIRWTQGMITTRIWADSAETEMDLARRKEEMEALGMYLEVVPFPMGPLVERDYSVTLDMKA